jgi:hypothetical protein
VCVFSQLAEFFAEIKLGFERFWRVHCALLLHNASSGDNTLTREQLLAALKRSGVSPVWNCVPLLDESYDPPKRPAPIEIGVPEASLTVLYPR